MNRVKTNESLLYGLAAFETWLEGDRESFEVLTGDELDPHSALVQGLLVAMAAMTANSPHVAERTREDVQAQIVALRQRVVRDLAARS